MAGHVEPGRSIQRPGRDADRLESGPTPEQAGAAFAAKTTPGPGVATGARDPAKTALLQQPEIPFLGRRRRRHVSVPPATFLAVADQHVLEGTGHLVGD